MIAAVQSDPSGYYARKAAREADIRNAAPYMIDDQPDIIGDYDTLVTRLASVSLSVEPGALRAGVFRIIDSAFGTTCGYVRSLYPTGRAAYEADLARCPDYHDGTPRPSWDAASSIARWSWQRNPTAK